MMVLRGGAENPQIAPEIGLLVGRHDTAQLGVKRCLSLTILVSYSVV
jgi:hypothetical protein